MATDIAFAMGVLALLGERIRPGLKVLLLAMAIVDDLGAIAVIAVFYAGGLDAAGLLVAGGTLAAAILLQRVGVWRLPPYIALGVVGWAGILASGVHPTIIGVAFGLLAPTRAWYGVEDFSDLAETQTRQLRNSVTTPDRAHRRDEQVDALISLDTMTTESIAPLDRLEHALHPIVAFVIVPLFAFANAGVEVSPAALQSALSTSLPWGIIVGLCVGKPLGIGLGIWLITRFGAALPAGATWSGIFGIGLLAGIGFTVSLLITDLAFVGEPLAAHAKVGILLASVIAGLSGFFWLRLAERLQLESAPKR